MARYHLLRQQRDDELIGTWDGAAGGLSFGGFYIHKKEHMWQVSFDIMAAQMSQKAEKDIVPDEENRRRLEIISLSIAYVFNAKGELFGASGMGGFVGSFW